MTISLPAAMAREVKRVSQLENRTTSELVREALRRYISGVPVVAVSASELRAIEKGRAEIRKGDYVSLDQLTNALASKGRKASPQKSRKNTSKRSK